MSRPVVCVLALALATAAQAQSVCSSDGEPSPSGLLERFINADCGGCWIDLRSPRPRAGEVALDWIVRGRRGDDAPLAAAARDEGLARLQALGLAVPRNDGSHRLRRQGEPVMLRLARGLAFNGYVGASIELKDAAPGRWRAWVALVEDLPPGTEKTPVARNLVRNVLELAWDVRGRRPESLFETRAMNIPEGASPERLRLVGLVEDARGRIRGIAQTRCTPEGNKE